MNKEKNIDGISQEMLNRKRENANSQENIKDRHNFKARQSQKKDRQKAIKQTKRPKSRAELGRNRKPSHGIDRNGKSTKKKSITKTNQLP